jgi:hypothetical protein
MTMDPERESPPPAEASPAAPAPAGPAQPGLAARQSPRWLNIAFVGAIGIAVAGVSFAVGRATAPSDLEQLRADLPGDGRVFVGPGQGQQRGQGFPGQGGQGGRLPIIGAGGLAIEGTVDSIDGDSMTMTTAGGRTIELSLDGDTDYHTAAPADSSAVTSGSRVVVRIQAGNGGGPGFGLDVEDVTVVP